MVSESHRIQADLLVSPAPGEPPPEPSPAGRVLAWLVPSLIVGLTAAAFWPALDGEFLDWDDDKLLVNNPHYRGLGPEQLRWMFTTNLLGHYQPVTWISYALDYHFFKLRPFAYHLSNLVIFAAGALLFYRVALRLLRPLAAARNLPGRSGLTAAAGVAALLYAVHPLRVETVAWITSRAYLLSSLFFLACVLFYLRWAERQAAGRGGGGQLALALLCYTLSLFSRANAVGLPLVLILLDLYPLGRLDPSPRNWFRPGRRRLWLEKIPFLLLAVVAAGLAHEAKTSVGTVATVQAAPLASRLAMGAYALCFYLLKTIWPSGLLPLYEKPPRIDPFETIYLLSGAFVVVVTLVLYGRRRRWPVALALWLYYLVMVAPVSGIVQIGLQIAADRYTQLACLGWALSAGAGLLYCWPGGESAGRRRVWPVAVALVCAGCAVALLVRASQNQSRVWLDRETLWRTTLAGNPHCLTALNNLTTILARSGRRDEAMQMTQRALELQPAFSDIHLNLGSLLLEDGRLDEAIGHFKTALDHGLESAEVYSNLGVAWAQKGDLSRALQYLEKAVALDPEEPEAHYNLGIVYARLDRLAEAEGEFLEALRLRPDYADAAHNLQVIRNRLHPKPASTSPTAP